MDLKYLVIKFSNPQELNEILMAELETIGFDSFMETEEGVEGYVEKALYEQNAVEDIISRYNSFSVNYSVSELENKNWNEEWEKNFSPVLIEDRAIIRASFHPSPGLPVEVVINPKMSFGTGHHETTYMMVQTQLDMDFREKNVMDAGTGTGVLAIIACKLGAKHVLAFDVEEWAFENLQENIKLNDCPEIVPAFGDITQVEHTYHSYDIILANINKNVLLKEIPTYSRYLQQGGKLVLSGFYQYDIVDIQNLAQEHSLLFTSEKVRNNWASLVFEKA